MSATTQQKTASPADPPAPPVRRRDLLSRGWVVALLGAVVPLTLLGAWHLASTTGVFAVYQLPPPASVWDAAVELAGRGELYEHIAISTQRVLLGFTAGSLLGLALGALVGLSRIWSVLLSPTMGAIRAVPSLAWIPLLLIWLKLGEDSKVTLVAIGAFFPVYTTVSAALKHVDPHLVEAARAFGLKGFALFCTVQLPAVLPSVVSGLRLAMAQAWLFLVAAELAGAALGLGFLLTDSQNNGRVDRVLLAIVLLAVLGKSTDALIGVGEKRFLKRWS